MTVVTNFRKAQPLLRRALSRRDLLRRGFLGLGLVGVGGALTACTGSSEAPGGDDPVVPPTEPPAPVRGRLVVPPLAEAPDENGLLIPQGFKSRVIAQANRPVGDTGFVWHSDPDAGAVFPAEDGGWVYVSNREFLFGGVNAIRFDQDGAIVDAYNILSGVLSRLNCGGGVTPWGTWLSGEETDIGYIWECDPFNKNGVTAARRIDGCGTFTHEAATVDPASNTFYLTEDMGDGCFYRFIPDEPNVGGRPGTSGKLQALKVAISQEELDAEGARGPWPVSWLDVPNPNPLQLPELPAALQPQTPTRLQTEASHFNGGEGIWCQNAVVYFTTKGDRRVWAHDLAKQTLEVIYDDFFFAPSPILDSVDNIVMTPGGDIVVVEDKEEANQQAVAIQPDGSLAVLVQLVGQDGSEVTGPAFSPDGRYFYFSSQRGPNAGGVTGFAGITYCVEGPWFTP